MLVSHHADVRSRRVPHDRRKNNREKGLVVEERERERERERGRGRE